MTEGRLAGTATSLANGSILLVGGHNGFRPNQTADLFDPASELYSRTGDLTVARLANTATLLQSGQVLVTGGTNSGSNIGSSSTELYAPSTGRFSLRLRCL
jgi:hypothetical protein